MTDPRALMPVGLFLVTEMTEFEANAVVHELDVTLKAKDEADILRQQWIGVHMAGLNGAVVAKYPDDPAKWRVLASEETLEYLRQSLGKYCDIAERRNFKSDVTVRKQSLTIVPVEKPTGPVH